MINLSALCELIYKMGWMEVEEDEWSNRLYNHSMRLLDVQNLSVELVTRHGVVRAVNNVDIHIEEGEILGLVGESGSGKTITCRAILRLLPKPAGRFAGGRILYQGKDLLDLSESAMRSLRGSEIAIIPQDPNTSLNPVFTTGKQLAESIRQHIRIAARQLKERSVELFNLVRIPAPDKRLQNYPHEMSGGMRQRAVGAIAMSCEPRLILADEPTTSLDATIQTQYLDLLLSLQQRTGVAILFVTHDFGIVGKVCDRVAVMYAGRVVEQGTTVEVFQKPAHPYTKGLLASVPSLDKKTNRLNAIPGEPPVLTVVEKGCPFAPRCDIAESRCHKEMPVRVEVSSQHTALCWKPSYE